MYLGLFLENTVTTLFPLRWIRVPEGFLMRVTGIMYINRLVSLCSSVWGGVHEGTLPFVARGRHRLSHRHFLTRETVYKGRLPG